MSKKILTIITLFIIVLIPTYKVEAKTLGDLKKELSNLEAKYEENKNKYNNILKTKINEVLKDYKVDNWVISNQLSTILAYNPDYKQKLEELLDSRIEEILDKI